MGGHVILAPRVKMLSCATGAGQLLPHSMHIWDIGAVPLSRRKGDIEFYHHVSRRLHIREEWWKLIVCSSDIALNNVRGMRWTGHVTRLGIVKMRLNFQFRGDHWCYDDVWVGMEIIKLFLNKLVVGMCNRSIWLNRVYCWSPWAWWHVTFSWRAGNLLTWVLYIAPN